MIEVKTPDGRRVEVEPGRTEEMILYVLEVRDRVERAVAGSITIFFKGGVITPQFRECSLPRRVKSRRP